MSIDAADDHSGEHHLDPKLVYQMSKMGIWLFLATEILLFAGLFTTYAVYRYKFPVMWHEAHHLLSVPFGTANTIILLASSFTVAWSVDAIKRNKTQLVNWLLIITIALGSAFMINKFFEYSHKTHPVMINSKALAPAYVAVLEKDGLCKNITKAGKAIQKCKITPFNPANIGNVSLRKPVFANLFISQYFVMTGIHGLHILIGLGVFIWVLMLNFKGKLNPDWFTPVEVGGIYWHLVDLIWIYLFPMLYLVS